MGDVHNGRCMCGAVAITARGPLRGVIYCHCRECRRQTGHFYAATNIRDDALEIGGSENVGWYAASPEALRGFCRTCGSALFWKRHGSEVTSVMAGLFDAPTALEGRSHIFTAEKGDYYDIADGLPQFAGSGG